eukprot:TRINITY_DN45417_c0_g1_i1.p1 TRINITY_DN45417_c0_g1~~TRINITY_DN45417_c0_g1_i1.p1  ORF type:complete len:447 (-),score=111.75 TRINITY_DN45417_c0_g1_i1:127-1467(-)
MAATMPRVLLLLAMWVCSRAAARPDADRSAVVQLRPDGMLVRRTHRGKAAAAFAEVAAELRAVADNVSAPAKAVPPQVSQQALPAAPELGLPFKTLPLAASAAQALGGRGSTADACAVAEAPPFMLDRHLPAVFGYLRAARGSAFGGYLGLASLGVALCAFLTVPALTRLAHAAECRMPDGCDASGAAAALLSAKRHKQRRALWSMAVCAGPLLVMLGRFLASVDPWLAPYIMTLLTVYEICGFWSLIYLVLDFLGGPDEEVVANCRKAEPLRMWMAPPLCFVWIFCVPCMHRRTMMHGDLFAVRMLMLQFSIVGPLCAFLKIAGVVVFRKELWDVLELCSLAFAMYGIFSLLRGGGELLFNHDRRHHEKFWVLKGSFIISRMGFNTFVHLYPAATMLGSACYSGEMMAHARTAALLAVLTPLLALLGSYSCSPQDLCGPDEPLKS